jgi:mono/diheme cytochrome c family protein
VSAELSSRVQRGICFSLLLALSGCSWFTDFKEQPKIDPWDAPNDSTPPRGNPQGSVPLYGTAAPEYRYGRDFAGLNAMVALTNPVAVSQESIDRGRKAYQVNCAVCHGPAGGGFPTSTVFKLAPMIAAPPIAANSNSANTLTDGYIFGIIRNGRGLMPSYNRIEEPTRWDIVNYIRTLQGKTGLAVDTTHGRPGETGAYLLGATQSAPTRPAPYYAPIGAQAGAREGLTGSSTTANPRATTGAAVPPDTTQAGRTTPPPATEHKPPTPEARK